MWLNQWENPFGKQTSGPECSFVCAACRFTETLQGTTDPGGKALWTRMEGLGHTRGSFRQNDHAVFLGENKHCKSTGANLDKPAAPRLQAAVAFCSSNSKKTQV